MQRAREPSATAFNAVARARGARLKHREAFGQIMK
jgi:hypothetical protein